MIALSVRHNFPEVQRALNRLQSDIRDKALAAALNKTADKAKTEMTRAISAEYAVKQADVRASLRVQRASAKNLIMEAALEAFSDRGRSWNLIRFLALRQTLGARNKANDLLFKIRRDRGVVPIKGAFILNVPGAPIFHRVGKGRKAIEPMQVINVLQMFTTKRISDRVIARIKAEFPVEFDRAEKLFVERFNS